MNWNIMWMILLACAYVLAIANIIRTAMQKKENKSLMIFLSLSFGMMSLLDNYAVFKTWFEYGRQAEAQSALIRSYPVLVVLISVLIALNFIPLVVKKKHDK